jgi:hypothetical protein
MPPSKFGWWHGWRRPGRSGGLLRRPLLAREMGRELAEVFLGEALGDRRHDRIGALAAAVVAQLLHQIALLLAGDDRDGLRFDRHTVGAVARGAGLRLRLDIVGCVSRYH